MKKILDYGGLVHGGMEENDKEICKYAQRLKSGQSLIIKSAGTIDEQAAPVEFIPSEVKKDLSRLVNKNNFKIKHIRGDYYQIKRIK